LDQGGITLGDSSRSRAFDPEFDWESKLLFTERHKSHAVSAFFGRPARKPEERLEQRHMDLAASIGAVTEEIMLRLTRSIAAKTVSASARLDGGGSFDRGVAGAVDGAILPVSA
jgi:predicted NodU family carbamoyl transferase